jgi:hypothetical protein
MCMFERIAIYGEPVGRAAAARPVGGLTLLEPGTVPHAPSLTRLSALFVALLLGTNSPPVTVGNPAAEGIRTEHFLKAKEYSCDPA